MSMIFKQTLALRADDLKDSAAVTLMGTDIERIVLTFNNLHQIWAAILEVSIAIFLLQRQIASASVVPVVISIVCAFGVIPVSKTIGRAQTAWIERLQKRVAVTASMLGDMKAIKMLGLSGVLSTTITELRRVELKTSEKFRKLILSQILVSNLPVEFAPFATFVIYSIIAVITKDRTLTTTNAFTALSLIGLLTEPLLMFCQFVPNIVQGTLARAVYSRHRVMVLDDVFSGLDSKSISQISSRLFSKEGHIRRNEISVILATHTRSLLRHADELIVLTEGQVLSQGSYEQVLASSSDLITKSKLEDDNNPSRGEEWEQAENSVKSTQIQRTLDVQEDRLRQNGSWSVYKYYFERAGWIVVGSFVFATFTEAFCSGFTNIWFQWWVEANEKRPNDNLGMYLGVAPLSFFQSTDTGSITNRFSQDLNLVDVTLPSNAINFASRVLFFVQRYYLRTSRQVRLLDIEAKAPIYTHFLETLKGVATIRAYRWHGNFEEQATKLLNISQKPHYMLACIQQWLALILDLVVGALALIIVAMATSITDKFSPGAIGVSMVLVLGFNNSLATTIKNWTALETSIGAVARIREFSQTTPSEERGLGSSGIPPERWPLQGRIDFDNVTARYTRDGDATLKNLTLSISSGQKIAVCGPSGSGKTSFVLSLLQMIEVTDGKILVDGIDLEDLERSEVRSRINVIPQEPLFIPGSVRFNLDPHSRESSETIKAALDRVGLLGKIGMAGGLDSELDADGFSAGERQLLALTRALIEKSQILILDEATSSVDQDTEDKMQRIIEEEFSDQTVVSVIHRLRFIEKYDRVLLLKQGEAVEWDTPNTLLATESEFKKLFAATQTSY
ncbi:hypothetical protein SGCOL_000058 [Colletotrichum sp. CLE4]